MDEEYSVGDWIGIMKDHGDDLRNDLAGKIVDIIHERCRVIKGYDIAIVVEQILDAVLPAPTADDVLRASAFSDGYREGSRDAKESVLSEFAELLDDIKEGRFRR